MMDKAPLNDPRLSLKAKGLLAYLLSKPPDWRPQIADICKHCREGRDSVQAAMQELRAAGYAVLLKENLSDGRLAGSEWVIHEKSNQNQCPTEKPNRIKAPTENLKNRDSAKPSPNKNDGTIRMKPKGEVEVIFEEMRNFPPAECTKPDSAAVHRENLIFLKAIGVSEGSHFWNEWIRRSESAPLRTACAIAFTMEEVAMSRSSNPITRGKPLRNPSGRAHWYFMNIDLDSTVGALKAGCRGKPIKTPNYQHQ